MLKSSSKLKKRHVIGILALAILNLLTTPGMAFDKINKSNNGIAIKGYDSVAYHTEGRAVKGNKNFSYKWNDAEWYFASAENRDLFAANPERYAPQYGGY
jgi:YHS domain-containing protein